MPTVSRACHREAPKDELWCLGNKNGNESGTTKKTVNKNVFVCRSNQLVKLAQILSGILGIITELRNAAGLPATANPPDQPKVPEVNQPQAKPIQATQPTQPVQPRQPPVTVPRISTAMPGTPIDLGPGAPQTPPGIPRGTLRAPGTPPMATIAPGTPIGHLHVANWEAPRTPPLSVAVWPGAWSPPMRPRPAPTVDIESRTPAAHWSPPMRPRPPPTADIEIRTPGRVNKKARKKEREVAASRAPPAAPSGTKRKSTNTNSSSQPSSSSSSLTKITKTFCLKMLASEQWLRSLSRKARSLESSCQVRIYIPDESGRYSSTSVEFLC